MTDSDQDILLVPLSLVYDIRAIELNTKQKALGVHQVKREAQNAYFSRKWHCKYCIHFKLDKELIFPSFFQPQFLVAGVIPVLEI